MPILSQLPVAMQRRQCDRIGRFWKFLATNCITKVAQVYGDFLAILKMITFKVNLLWLLLDQLLAI